MTGQFDRRLSGNDLLRELDEYRDRYPKLGYDELFILWFLRAFITDNEEDAAKALCGGSRDKGIDALLIDESAGAGPTAIDVSSFFRRRNLHKEFAKYWRGPANKAQSAFDNAWAKFQKALDEELTR